MLQNSRGGEIAGIWFSPAVEGFRGCSSSVYLRRAMRLSSFAPIVTRRPDCRESRSASDVERRERDRFIRREPDDQLRRAPAG